MDANEANGTRKLSDFSCPNTECPLYELRGAGNLHWYKTGKRLECSVCGKVFSASYRSLFYRLKGEVAGLLPEVVIGFIEGLTVRGIAAKHSLSTKTVMRCLERASSNPEEFGELLAARGMPDKLIDAYVWILNWRQTNQRRHTKSLREEQRGREPTDA